MKPIIKLAFFLKRSAQSDQHYLTYFNGSWKELSYKMNQPCKTTRKNIITNHEKLSIYVNFKSNYCRLL